MTAQVYKRATIEIDGASIDIENLTITMGDGQEVRPAPGFNRASGRVEVLFRPTVEAMIEIPRRYRSRDKLPRGGKQNLCGAPPVSWTLACALLWLLGIMAAEEQ